MDTIKILLIAIGGTIYNYLSPIHNPMQVLAFVFCADIVAGVLVDLIVQKDRLQIKKFLFALLFLAIYLSIIASTFTIGERMGDKDEALIIVKTLTYILMYFYVSNTFRNLCLLFPQSKPLAFIYYWLGLQVVKRLPDLARYLGLGTPNNNKDGNTDN